MTIDNDYERRVLRGALAVYRKQIERRIHATDRQGWSPEPGKVDGNRKRLETIDALVERWHLIPEDVK